MSTSREDAAWAAGLFEGEGCVFLNRRTSRGRSSQVNGLPYRPAVGAHLQMTDEDVVRRFASVVGYGAIYPRPSTPPRKPTWRWQTGKRADVIALWQMFEPYMGQRRTDQFCRVLWTTGGYAPYDRAWARDSIAAEDVASP